MGTTRPTTATTTVRLTTTAGRRPGISRPRAAAAALVATALLGGLAAAPAASAASTASAAAPAAGSAAPARAAASASNDEVVVRWYVDLLGRSGRDALADAGRGYWVRQLDAGTPREQVLAELTRTPEFARVSVRAIYLRLLGSEPDAGARYWTDNVPRGMAVEWVEQNVLASPQFTALEPDDAWMKKVYREVLGREASPGETAYWLGRYGDLGALGIVRAIWYSSEAVGGRVANHYAELLGRSASPGEVGYWRAAEVRSDLGVRTAIASSGEHARTIDEASPTTTPYASTVETFLDALGSQRRRAAYGLLTPQARSAAGGYAGFTAGGGLADRLEPFASVPRRGYLAINVTEGSAAVVAAGEVARGSGAGFDTASFGVRYDGGDGRLGIDVGVRPTTLTLGPADRRLPAGKPVTLAVDRRGQQAGVGVLVDGRYVGPVFDAGSAGTRFSLAPGALAPGRHVVTAYASTGTVLQVESATFQAP